MSWDTGLSCLQNQSEKVLLEGLKPIGLGARNCTIGFYGSQAFGITQELYSQWRVMGRNKG